MVTSAGTFSPIGLEESEQVKKEDDHDEVDKSEKHDTEPMKLVARNLPRRAKSAAGRKAVKDEGKPQKIQELSMEIVLFPHFFA